EDNLVICQVAKKRFRAPRTIARINNPKNELIFKKLGIDMTVSATQAILTHIEQELPTHHLIPLMRIRRSGFEMVEATLNADSPAAGRRLGDLELPEQSAITLIVDADGMPRAADADTVLRPGEQVFAFAPADSEDDLRELLLG
ncbi:MAG TPA: TrkA C-terminal domain-containing protein, partial [Dehalococcoidia bacterium]|nr:TrkA C-terminal domain-containing protein [Dehalococcoidia bacterium]